MLVLAPSPELLALLETLASELDKFASEYGPFVDAAATAWRAHLAAHPGEPIPHGLVERLIVAAADSWVGPTHPLTTASRAVADHVTANPPRLAKEPSARPTAPATPSPEADASPAGGAATPTAAEASATDALARAAASLTTAVSLAEAATRRGLDVPRAGEPA